VDNQVSDIIERTPFVDTHEHLVEESRRVSGALHQRVLPCNDWTYLFLNYVKDDLANAGLPAVDEARFFSPDTPVAEKYRLIAPYWERVRHTGYARAVRLTLQDLYGEDDLTAETAPSIAERFHALIRPGFYREILVDRANIEYAQVNSLERIFMETEQPDLLPQDLSIVALSRVSPLDRAEVERDTGLRPDSLDGWLEAIDWYFTKYGPRAVAVKCQIAYTRPLDFEAVPKARAARLFPRHADAAGTYHPLGPDDLKTLQDYLIRYSIGKAGEYGLPVKLHTGYHAGRNSMPLDWLKRNATDIGRLLLDFPDTKFIIMHIGYPYQNELIALAKHFQNAYVDMCWAWIISPVACVHFLKEFLVTAPSNKILTFGGDYTCVEAVYGHSRIARRGIELAFRALLGDGWLAPEDVSALIERIMRGNAHHLFPKLTK
jgi:hypothetical protein